MRGKGIWQEVPYRIEEGIPPDVDPEGWDFCAGFGEIWAYGLYPQR